MYQLKSLHVIARGPAARWMHFSPMDSAIVHASLEQLRSKYRRIVATLFTDATTPEFQADLSQLDTHPVGHLTLGQLWVALGSQTLAPLSPSLSFSTRTAVWMDAFRANFKVKEWSATYGDQATPSERCDALLTHDDQDYTALHRYTLASAAGYLHRTDTDGVAGVVVRQANTTRLKSGQNTLGLLSLWSVGEVEQLSIPDSGVLEYQKGIDLASEVFIKLSPKKIKLGTATVFFVIAGRLFTPDNAFIHRISEDTWKLQLAPMGLLSQLVEANEVIDLSSLGLATTFKNRTQVSVAQLLSDALIRKVFALSQTFAVVVDAPDVYTSTIGLRRVGLEGHYVTPLEPIFPMIYEGGRLADYWYRANQPDHMKITSWSLYTPRNLSERMVHRTVDPHAQYSIDHSLRTVEPRSVPHAYFLEIGRDL